MQRGIVDGDGGKSSPGVDLWRDGVERRWSRDGDDVPRVDDTGPATQVWQEKLQVMCCTAC